MDAGNDYSPRPDSSIQIPGTFPAKIGGTDKDTGQMRPGGKNGEIYMLQEEEKRLEEGVWWL